MAKMGMSVMVISRSEEKLKEQVAELKAAYSGANIKYIAYDYTDMGLKREAFYQTLDQECAVMDKDGGIALLINNVGIANQYPQLLQELTDKECSDMINCNIDSTIFMSRAVLKYMTPKDRGAIVNVSSVSPLFSLPRNSSLISFLYRALVTFPPPTLACTPLQKLS